MRVLLIGLNNFDIEIFNKYQDNKYETIDFIIAKDNNVAFDYLDKEIDLFAYNIDRNNYSEFIKHVKKIKKIYFGFFVSKYENYDAAILGINSKKVVDYIVSPLNDESLKKGFELYYDRQHEVT